MDGSREDTLISHGANDQFPVWAPSGDQVLFYSDRAGTPGLWMISFVDGKPWGDPELVKSDMGIGRPRGFARDGSFYFAINLGPDNVFGVSLHLEQENFSESRARLSTIFSGGTSPPRIPRMATTLPTCPSVVTSPRCW